MLVSARKYLKKTIVDAVNDGADTLDKVKEITGACCGRCNGKRCVEVIEESLPINKHTKQD